MPAPPPAKSAMLMTGIVLIATFSRELYLRDKGAETAYYDAPAV